MLLLWLSLFAEVIFELKYENKLNNPQTMTIEYDENERWIATTPNLTIDSPINEAIPSISSFIKPLSKLRIKVLETGQEIETQFTGSQSLLNLLKDAKVIE
eukprot:NODE_887_length_3307_cov_0.181733.p6 type:complete len:101 gc:universal NODE_887_length_3307_cov_0.181733:1325-1023(-)